jgi:hypothetical protein
MQPTIDVVNKTPGILAFSNGQTEMHWPVQEGSVNNGGTLNEIPVKALATGVFEITSGVNTPHCTNPVTTKNSGTGGLLFEGPETPNSSECADKVERLKKELKELEDELGGLPPPKEKSPSEKGPCDDEIAKASAELEKAKDNERRKKQIVDNLGARASDRANKEYEDAKKATEAAQQKLDDLKKKCEDAQKEADKTEKRREELPGEIAQKKKELEDAEAELKKCQEEELRRKQAGEIVIPGKPTGPCKDGDTVGPIETHVTISCVIIEAKVAPPGVFMGGTEIQQRLVETTQVGTPAAETAFINALAAKFADPLFKGNREIHIRLRHTYREVMTTWVCKGGKWIGSSTSKIVTVEIGFAKVPGEWIAGSTADQITNAINQVKANFCK